MKWSRAVEHLENLVRVCAESADIPRTFAPVRVEQLWAVGEVLGTPRDLDAVTVALAVDLPVDKVPWLSEPPEVRSWASFARLDKNPVISLWRSIHAPIWNHDIHRPALLWDATDGVAEETLEALRAGRGETIRTPPPTAAEWASRLDDELRVSLKALRARSHYYDRKRFTPTKLAPMADALALAVTGYLDVLDAVDRTQAGVDQR